MKSKSSFFAKKYFCFFIFSSLVFSSFIKAQAPPQLIADSLQAILDRSLPSGFTNSGCIMKVVSPGQWEWEGATGKAIAGVTAGQPITTASPQHQFRVGSITKMMVATCILKLEQQGLLNINDAVNPYLRSTLINDTLMPSDSLRIRHLLNHTSGIPNSADNTACQMSVLQNPLGSHTLEEAIHCGASQGEIFSPGIIWAYSNTNYSILAMIIENVTGMSYQQYITQNIFVPLNLNNTLIPTTNQIQQAHMGCYWNIGAWTDLTIINPTTYLGWADVVSTNQDLITFYQALQNGNIINSTELAIMKTIDAASYDYGMGMDFYTFLNSSYYGHYGEVANTSGLFFADVNSALATNGYYISYNFNVQGADMQNKLDIPILELLKNNSIGFNLTTADELSVYPNPTTNFFTFTNPNSKYSELKVLDLQGRILLQKEISGEKMNIDISEFAKGIYFVSLSNTETKSVLKLIKE